jgi:hypothetical protein
MGRMISRTHEGPIRIGLRTTRVLRAGSVPPGGNGALPRMLSAGISPLRDERIDSKLLWSSRL